MSHEAEVRDRFRMNDQQWVLQRKKIGLSRRNKKALHTRLVEERQKMSAITYIHTHFNRKECTKFVPTSGQVKTIDIKYFFGLLFLIFFWSAVLVRLEPGGTQDCPGAGGGE